MKYKSQLMQEAGSRKKLFKTSCFRIFMFFASCFVLQCLAGCGGSSTPASSCVASTSCCGGSGYSHDGGTSCYSDSGCTTACASTCVANSNCCGGTGYSNDGGTTCYSSSNCSSGCGDASVTELKLTNTQSTAITIGFVTAAYGGACLEGEIVTAEYLASIGWCTGYEAGVNGAGKCLITLGAAGSSTASVFVPNPDNKCISGSFGTGGFASCQTTQYPDGWTQGEFTINPKQTTQEAIDISAVNGINYEMSIVPGSGWLYEDDTAVVDQVGPNKSINANVGIHGVYPNACTDCIQLVGDAPCPAITPSPLTCNSTRICNVYRSSAPGGTVEFVIGGML